MLNTNLTRDIVRPEIHTESRAYDSAMSNKLWNNSSPETLAGTVLINLGNNDTLGGNPFKLTGQADHNDDDFTVDSSVKAGGWPDTMFDPDGNFGLRNLQFLDVGALQRVEPAGGPFARSLIVQNIGTY